jgi:hypothetical protein
MQLEPLEVVGDVLRDKIANLNIKSAFAKLPRRSRISFRVGRTAPCPDVPCPAMILSFRKGICAYDDRRTDCQSPAVLLPVTLLTVNKGRYFRLVKYFS